MPESLKWRRAVSVEFVKPLTPGPNHTGPPVTSLSDVRIAFDNGFVHIDCRDQNEDLAGEFEWYALPASAVGRIVFHREVEGEFQVYVFNEDDFD